MKNAVNVVFGGCFNEGYLESLMSDNKSKDEGISLREEIERDSDIYGGLFTSDEDLYDPEEFGLVDPWYCNQSFDFVFVGKHPDEEWYANIYTAKHEFWDKVYSLAFEQATALLSPEEREKEFKFKFKQKVCGYIRVPKDPIYYPQFDGLTFAQYREQLIRKIITSEPPEIYEYFELNGGSALSIVIDAQYLTYSLIDKTIDRFLALGQKSWKSEIPVAREHLFVETKFDAALMT